MPAATAPAPKPPATHTKRPARLGDDTRHALEDLVIAAEPLVRWLAWQRYNAQEAVRAAVGPEDLAQEILLRAVRQFHRYNPERCAFSTWLGVLARDVAREVRQRVRMEQANANIISGTDTSVATGEERDRFAELADAKADDPAEVAAVALVRVLVPVVEVRAGACPAAWVRDARTGQRVQVPSQDVVTYRDRFFAVATSFDEGDELHAHRVRFENGAVAWVNAAPVASR